MSSKSLHVLFDDDDILLDAVKQIVKSKIHINEIYTPFPVHGLDKAMKLKPTNISIATFIYGCIGFTVAVMMMNYIMIVDWPQNIGGKPSFSYIENMPAFVPVMFELTVFFAAHLMCWSYFAVNKLYPGAKAQNPDPRTTDDHFLMEVELEGKETDLTKKLQELGALEISKVEA